MNHVLRISGDADRIVRLRGATVRIGRAPACELRVDDPRASRVHCVIEPFEGGFRLVDPGSRNGTRVNDVLVSQARLHPGDRIGIGSIELIFDRLDRVPGASPAPAPRSSRRRADRRRAPGPVPIAATAAILLVAVALPFLLRRRPTSEPKGDTAVDRTSPGEPTRPAWDGYLHDGDGPNGEKTRADVTPERLVETRRRPAEREVAAPAPHRAAGRSDPSDPRPPGRARDAPPGAIHASTGEGAPGGTTGEAVAATPDATPEGPLSKYEVYLLLEDVEDLARSHDHVEALARIDDALSRCRDRVAREDLLARRADVEGRARLHVALVAALERRDRPIPLPGGRSISEADHDGVRLVGGSAVPWAEIRAGDYVELALRAELHDPDALLGLAAFCFDAPGLEDRGHRVLEQLLETDPTARPRADALLARELGIDPPPGGFPLFEHRFVRPAQYRDLATRAEISEHERRFGEGTGFERRVAYGALRALGDEGREVLHRELPRLRERILDELDRTATGRAVQRLLEDRERLERRREEFLGLVFDRERYPDVYRAPEADATARRAYRASQDRIDKKTRELWSLWRSGDSRNVRLAPIDPLLSQLREVHGWLDEMRIPRPRGAGAHVLERLPRGMARVGLHNLPLDGDDVDWWIASQEALAANARYDGAAAPWEIELVAVTNRYRMLLGRRALAISDALARAARGHSEEMSRLGYFAHESPTAGLENPEKRALHHGFGGTHVGENIARGRVDPEAAHLLWCHSPPHHRNILGEDWTHQGTGRAGAFWTSNFGRADRPSGPAPR